MIHVHWVNVEKGSITQHLFKEPSSSLSTGKFSWLIIKHGICELITFSFYDS